MTVYCFSATGRSRSVAQFFAEKLGAELRDICPGMPLEAEKTAVVVFPVYCQNIPEPVRQFLPRLDAKYVALIACYGRMHHGNVLTEAAKLISGQVIAAAYVPIGHTYLNEPPEVDAQALMPILQRFRDPKPAKIRREFKNPLADFFPKLRGQLGVRLTRTAHCDSCGVCTRCCPVGAMDGGIPDSSCIRCLGCVAHCPRGALEVSYSLPLRLYLKKQKKSKTILYL